MEVHMNDSLEGFFCNTAIFSENSVNGGGVHSPRLCSQSLLRRLEGRPPPSSPFHPLAVPAVFVCEAQSQWEAPDGGPFFPPQVQYNPP